MSKHTKGPWYIAAGKEFTAIQANGVESNIAKLDFQWAIINEEQRANAKLIAAAPELLENLARIIDRIEEINMQDNFPSAYKRAKEAINKATL